MGKKKTKKVTYKREKPHCNIGTIGHVDHGKTTLTAAITRVLSLYTRTKYTCYEDIDRHREERKRGITINASHIEYETDNRHYTHIDCPGHRDYVKNMITGATQMDGVILVISVIEGPQEQTREHLILAREVGIEHLVVYVNKMDALKEPDLKYLVEIEILDLLESYAYSSEIPLTFGSAVQALYEEEESSLGISSIKGLMEIIEEHIPQPRRAVDGTFIMPIEEIFSIPGRGTVVAGKVECGVVRIDAALEIVGRTVLKTSCVGLEMYHKVLEHAEAGENIGVLLRGVKKSVVFKGFVLADPGTITPFRRFEATAYILTREEGGRRKLFMSDYKPQFYFRTTNVTGSIFLLGSNMFAMPGDTVKFEVTLVEKCAVNVGLRFTIREGHITVGAGIITGVG